VEFPTATTLAPLPQHSWDPLPFGLQGKKAGTAEVVHLAHVWHPLRETFDYLAAGAERELLGRAHG